MVNRWPRKFLHNPWALPHLLETSSKAEQNKHKKRECDFTVGELKNEVGKRQEEEGTAREEEVLEGEPPVGGFPGALVTAQGWLIHTPGWAASPLPLPKQTCKNRACRSD